MSVVAGVLGGVAGAGLVAVMNTALHRSDIDRWLLAGAFAGAVVAKLAGAALARFLLNSFVLDAIVYVFRDLSRKVVATPLRQVERLGAARILTTLTEDVATLAVAVQEAPGVAVNLAVVAGCAAYLGWLSWRVLAGVVIFVVAGVLVYRLAIGRASHWLQQARDTREQLFRHFQALTGGTKELQLHRRRREAFLHDTIDETTSKLRQVSTAAVRVYVVAGIWSQLLFSALLGGLVFLGPGVKGMSTETLTGYLLATLYLMTPLWAIIDSWPVFARARVALQKIQALQLSLGGEVDDGDDSEAPS
jgi:putative ATP-binding cassette transporter